MSLFRHLRKKQQQIMPLFNGAFVENKPIPFPEKQSSQAYSNLFYWAHLEAKETAEFPLHPHQGFEIMTFVFEGSLEHFDTATKIWTPLGAGGVQVIQAGSFVQHAERIKKGSRLFQIWFDPDMSNSLNERAAYKDYQSGEFSYEEEKGIRRLHYLQEKGPIKFITAGLDIQKIEVSRGKYEEIVDKAFIYSYYLLSGALKMDDINVKKDDFIVFEYVEKIDLDVKEEAEIFMIKTPRMVEYKRYIEKYGT